MRCVYSKLDEFGGDRFWLPSLDLAEIVIGWRKREVFECGEFGKVPPHEDFERTGLVSDEGERLESGRTAFHCFRNASCIGSRIRTGFHNRDFLYSGKEDLCECCGRK